jgi:hypothetical protein
MNGSLKVFLHGRAIVSDVMGIPKNMRSLLLIYLLTFTRFCFGQNLELVETDDEKYYRVLKDSLAVNLNYPDGRYKTFATDTTRKPSQVFHLKDGMVDGPYLELATWGWIYGTYSQDSMWTFLTAPNDTTYMIGTWRKYYYALEYSTQDIFIFPYDSNGVFAEVWRFYNGHIAREALFKKGFGLEKETYWDFETNKISKQVINSGNGNYYQSITYENDSISNVLIKQNGVEINMDLNYELCEDKPCIDIEFYSEPSDMNNIPMATLTIDGNKTLTDFVDVKKQISVRENGDRSLSIQYVTKNGKSKWKKIKVK